MNFIFCKLKHFKKPGELCTFPSESPLAHHFVMGGKDRCGVSSCLQGGLEKDPFRRKIDPLEGRFPQARKMWEICPSKRQARLKHRV